MECDVWVEFDEPVNWDDKFSDWATGAFLYGTPKHKSPYFPGGHEAFSEVTKLRRLEKYESGVIDELTGYVIVPKSEILELIKKLQKTALDHMLQRLNELYNFIDSLPDKNYKLVQNEFWKFLKSTWQKYKNLELYRHEP